MTKGWFVARPLLFAVAYLSTAPFCTLAQTSATKDKPLAFEVVSIRADSPAARGHSQTSVTADGWHMGHGALIEPLLTAYVPTTSDAMMYTASTIVGLPDWVLTEMYTVDAKVGDTNLAAWGDPATQQTMLRSMVQAMLADRCKLAVHRDSKEVSVYLLVAGRNGPKLKVAVPGGPHPGAMQLPGGGEFLPNDATGSASFYAAPIKALAVILSNLAGRPIEDKTGLTGLYDMSFRRPIPNGAPMEPDSGANAPPTIFDVVESFGLKLQAAKSSVETLVIDHIERPTPN